MMQAATTGIDKFAPHWLEHMALMYGAASVAASMLIQILWTPLEIAWRPYVLFYKLVERLAFVRRPPDKLMRESDKEPDIT